MSTKVTSPLLYAIPITFPSIRQAIDFTSNFSSGAGIFIDASSRNLLMVTSPELVGKFINESTQNFSVGFDESLTSVTSECNKIHLVGPFHDCYEIGIIFLSNHFYISAHFLEFSYRLNCFNLKLDAESLRFHKNLCLNSK